MNAAQRDDTMGRHGFTAIEEAFFSAEIPPIDACDLPFESWASRAVQRMRGWVWALRGRLSG